ncbi:MAG: LytTR family DNA-binding domain-containing protein [Bacteroidales bacterium]|jgi:DNA-binding LytR/AlgR family response regulator|nr:LytTR family DNA-binding domain-containing protein [Bacteroidales bacterium]
MTIKCITIDDEPLALKQIIGFVEKTPFLELVASCKSAFEAMEVLSKENIDLMFVDIQMPDLTGIDFVKSLNKEQKIIFTTAYQEYAVEGFKVDALDYLLKPFGYDEFLKAANKAKSHFDLIEKATVRIELKDDYLFVKSEYKIKRVSLNDILYIEGLREYVKIVLKDEKPVMSLMSLKSLEEKLPSDRFMRVHRSFIVNLDEVQIIERSRIIFGKTYIPVSDQYKDKFQEFLGKRFI